MSDPDNDGGAGIGHNGVPATQLQKIVERIENLETEKKEVADRIKEVYDEAKGDGFDPKILRKVVALRKRKPEDITEEQSMLEIYMHALGMLPE